MAHQMTDKEILSSLLARQKMLATEYNHTASHTDDPQLLQILTDTIRETHQTRLEIYQAMHARGWYNPQPIQQNQIDQAKHKFQGVEQQLRSIVNQRPTAGTAQQFQTSGPQNFGFSTGGTTASPQHQGFQQQAYQNPGWQGSSFTQHGFGQQSGITPGSQSTAGRQSSYPSNP